MATFTKSCWVVQAGCTRLYTRRRPWKTPCGDWCDSPWIQFDAHMQQLFNLHWDAPELATPKQLTITLEVPDGNTVRTT